ncbi:MAG: hypoxanthine phosphoribosyltransferase [Anaerolineae bacterium]|jgi:hypoxanthine phosphoribosyltransferase|nr:hypoxanthine phosphoribosyltransferase [Anaerolineae bacterium]
MGQPYEKYLQEILIGEDALQVRIRELGEQISADYADTKNLLLICILKGGVMFLADLARHITVPHRVDFMAISSYGAGVREASGHVRIDMDLRQDIQDKHILIVEDIIDSGHTMNYILSLLSTRNPASLRVCTLLSKPGRREVPISLDYVGFEIPNKFVFGYGLDLDELFRNLPFVGVCKPDMQIGDE